MISVCSNFYVQSSLFLWTTDRFEKEENNPTQASRGKWGATLIQLRGEPISRQFAFWYRVRTQGTVSWYFNNDPFKHGTLITCVGPEDEMCVVIWPMAHWNLEPETGKLSGSPGDGKVWLRISWCSLDSSVLSPHSTEVFTQCHMLQLAASFVGHTKAFRGHNYSGQNIKQRG